MNDPAVSYTVATFVYLAHRAGVSVADGDVAAACAAVDAGGGEQAEETGKALVSALQGKIGAGSPDEVTAALSVLLGVQANVAGGASREERVASIRRALFGKSTPWLAWILEQSQGELFSQCVLVEGFSETAQLADPNPFNDIDERVVMAIPEFMARWELAGCRSLVLA